MPPVTKTRQMEVYQLTLNADGTVDSLLRPPANGGGGAADPGMAYMAGGERVHYDSKDNAPALGQLMDVTYAPAATTAAAKK